jgi:hypothetical protein
MDDEEFCEIGDGCACEPARIPGRFRWTTPLIIGVQVVEEMGTAVVDGIGNLKLALWNHETFLDQRETFAAEAGRELETIVGGDE